MPFTRTLGDHHFESVSETFFLKEKAESPQTTEDQSAHICSSIHMSIKDSAPHAEHIQVIYERGNLNSLATGYYLRFIKNADNTCYVYGLEVLEPGNIIAHQSIPAVDDPLFQTEISALMQRGRVFLREGDSAALQKDLAGHYSSHGSIGVYVNETIAKGKNLPLNMNDFLPQTPSDFILVEQDDSSVLRQEKANEDSFAITTSESLFSMQRQPEDIGTPIDDIFAAEPTDPALLESIQPISRFDEPQKKQEASVVKSLAVFIEEQRTQKDQTLLSMATGIFYCVDAYPYKDKISILDGACDLNSLEPGYYLRLIKTGAKSFHLFGVEVLEKGNILIHENIPRGSLENHQDSLYKEQLLALHNQGRVLFRKANQIGGGAELHEDLAIHFAEHGSVLLYVNTGLCNADRFPKTLEAFLPSAPSSIDTIVEPQKADVQKDHQLPETTPHLAQEEANKKQSVSHDMPVAPIATTQVPVINQHEGGAGSNDKSLQKQKLIKEQCDVLQNKLTDLNQRRLTAQPGTTQYAKLDLAYRAVETLHTRISNAATQYFSKAGNIEFKSQCLDAIKDARGVLEMHRAEGWKSILDKIAKVIERMFQPLFNSRLTLFKTDSHKKLNDVEDVISNKLG